MSEDALPWGFVPLPPPLVPAVTGSHAAAPTAGQAEAAPRSGERAAKAGLAWYESAPPMAATMAAAEEARGLLRELVREIDGRAGRFCALAEKLYADPNAALAGWDAARAEQFLQHLAAARKALD